MGIEDGNQHNICGHQVVGWNNPIDGAYAYVGGNYGLGVFRDETCVWQGSPIEHLPIVGNVLKERVYQYMEPYSIALALAALRSRDYPGMDADGIAYPFEYSSMNRRRRLDRQVAIELAEGRRSDSDIRVLEIGGQEGRWMNYVFNIQYSEQSLYSYGGYPLYDVPPEFHHTIIDLDLRRRFRDRFPRTEEKIHKLYIQGDGHRMVNIIDYLGIPKFDMVAMMNVHDVIFDPFQILRNSWDLLKPKGLIVIGSINGFSLEMPFVPFQNSSPLEDFARYYSPRDFKYFKERFNRGNRDLRRAVPEKSFVYASFDRSHLLDPILIKIGRILNESPDINFDFSLAAVLRSLGYSAEEIADYNGQGVVTIIKKRVKDAVNPFSLFTAWGIISRYFHVGEYRFPQVFHRIDFR